MFVCEFIIIFFDSVPYPLPISVSPAYESLTLLMETSLFIYLFVGHPKTHPTPINHPDNDIRVRPPGASTGWSYKFYRRSFHVIRSRCGKLSRPQFKSFCPFIHPSVNQMTIPLLKQNQMLSLRLSNGIMNYYYSCEILLVMFLNHDICLRGGWDENDGDHLADYTVCLLAKSTDWMTWIPLFHVLISFHGEIFNSSHLPDAFLFVLFFLLLQSCWLLLRRLLLLKPTHLPTHLPSP